METLPNESLETGFVHYILFDGHAKAKICDKRGKTDTVSLIFPNLFC